MNINPSNVPGQPSNVDPTTNPQPNVGNSGLQGDPSLPTLEALQKQLADAKVQLAKFEQNNFELREKERQRKQKELEDKAALEQKLKEQGEFQQLALQHEARVKQLEPVEQQYTALSAVLNEQIKTQTKDWPQEVRDLLPGDDEPVEKRYEHVQRLQILVNKMAESQRGQLPGNSPGPKPAGQQVTDEQRRERHTKSQRATGHYPTF